MKSPQKPSFGIKTCSLNLPPPLEHYREKMQQAFISQTPVSVFRLLLKAWWFQLFQLFQQGVRNLTKHTNTQTTAYPMDRPKSQEQTTLCRGTGETQKTGGQRIH